MYNRIFSSANEVYQGFLFQNGLKMRESKFGQHQGWIIVAGVNFIVKMVSFSAFPLLLVNNLFGVPQFLYIGRALCEFV